MNKIGLCLSGLLLLSTFFGCKKNEAITLPYATYGVAADQGQLKFVYASAYLANPSVLIKVNGQVVSNLITGRTPFPGGGYNTTGSNFPLYLAVPQGADTVSIVRPRTGTAIDSIELYRTVINIPDNGAYTLHIADTLASATLNKTTSVLVQNDISAVDTGSCRYRFVNLIPNVPGTNGAVDLYLNGVKLDSNIAYKQAGRAFTIRTGANAPGVTDPTNIPTPSWTIRPAGTAPGSTAIATYTSTNTMISQRVYTIFSMGYFGATGTRLPYVSFTLDKNN